MSTKQKQTDGTGARKRDGLWMIPGCLGMVVLNAAISYGIVRLNTPVTVAFNMKQTVDAFFDSAGQKKLTEAQSKALSGRFNAALDSLPLPPPRAPWFQCVRTWNNRAPESLPFVLLLRLIRCVAIRYVYLKICSPVKSANFSAISLIYNNN